MHRTRPVLGLAVTLIAAALGAPACSSSDDAAPGAPAGGDAASDTPVADAGETPVSAVPADRTLPGPSLTSLVDVVRDEHGIPHFYGKELSDIAYAQGYFMAQDRWLQMDLLRRQGAGRLAEVAGVLEPSLIDSDIQMRVHHLESTAVAAWAELQASTDAKDRQLVTVFTQFAAGVNAWIADLGAGKYALPTDIGLLYGADSVAAWKPTDTLLMAAYEEFLQGYSEADLTNTKVEARAVELFDHATDPKLAARAGFAADVFDFRPFDPTYTIDGWTGQDGTTARLAPRDVGELLPVLDADRSSRRGMPGAEMRHVDVGSNNWVVGPALSATGNVLVANDPHLPMLNPPVWYLSHIAAHGGSLEIEAMGANLAGIPGVAFGMNRHVAWGITDSFVDVADFFEESVVACDGSSDPCVLLNGSKVALTSRDEKIDVGSHGKTSKTYTVKLWEVPHHGPVIPRLTAAHEVEALGTTELSVAYTGHQKEQVARTLYGLLTASTVTEAVAAIDGSWRNVGLNWVLGDDTGHFGWTERARVPRRAAGHVPWKVLPGDGTAEWGADLDPKYIPHAFDPAKGYLATANNDPIGVTADGEPFAHAPVVDGAPLYLGWDYDRGTRIGRITQRITEGTAGGKKLTLDDMSSIQGDAITELGPAGVDVLKAAVQALLDEQATPGAHEELASLLASASSDAKAALAFAKDKLAVWSFDTPAGVDEDAPTAAQIADSQATLVFFAWAPRALDAALADEVAAVGVQGFGVGSFSAAARKSLFGDQSKLASGVSDATSDSILWDDLATESVESRLYMTSRALLDALGLLSARLGADTSKWRWGTLHTVTFKSLLPMASLDIPPPSDPTYPHGFPRHGATGTVDVANQGDGIDAFSYSEGPSMRFTCELTPNGPRARNALPGGEVFDKASPHYRDLAELWRKNQAADLAFADADVLASAQKEYATHQIGRTRFAP